MRWLIGIFIVIGCAYGGFQLYDYFHTFKQEEDRPRWAASPPPSPADVNAGSHLPGLPSALEVSLSQAQAQGGRALGQWLLHSQRKVHDPRLAWIQLDYVVLIAPADLYEARKVFKEVKARTEPSSPVYPRVKQLEKTYDQ
jgi:hypothetical protein